ncbi:MAG: 3-oxoacyl-(acyl-carrier-protein) synthase, partial [Saprospiraceae bacterium]
NQNTTQDSHFPTRPRLPLPDAVGTISSKQDNVEFGLSLSEERRTITFLNTKDFTNFQNLIPEHKKSTLKTTKNPPAIFILSPPRSGTTLLRVMLAGHPDIFSANELQVLHFDDLQERAKAYEGKFSLWKEGSIRALMALKNIEADEAKYLMQKEEETATSSQEFYRNIQNLLDGKILVDKSPSYILDKNALQRAEDIFENAFYIHLYRHPYSMTKSFEKMHMDQVMYLKKHNYSARQLGELIWQQSHQNAIDFLNHIPKHRQFNISYETLISDPETSMKNLCERFGIDFHLNLLKPYEGLDHKMTDGIYKDSKPMGDINLLQHGKINPDLANKWKGVLHDNFLHENTWKTAKALGYPEVESSQGLKESSAQETPLKQVSNLRPQSNPLQGEADLRSLPQNKDIAIIGLSVRFPGAKDLEEFWQNLIQAKDISREFTAEELLAEGIDPQTINDPDYIRRGMYLEDADCFDAEFFGYLPKEAALMDPQHRVFLECAYASLEDAGYDPERTNLNIGVFGGVARNTYLINNVLTHPNYFNSLDDFQLGITLEKDFPATRVAYKLNLKGPAVNVQTACSSSGVAVHLACQSIRAGDSDIVIVGGGRIQPPIASGHLHKEGHALSPDGYCRTFDAGANGMVRGHGMSFIVLKNLDKAIADGDNIHAIIKGTAINNDGADKIGFTAPSIKGQSEAIIKAYQNAGINPETLSYIEAHGTGTAIGDPIEIAGLTTAFKAFTHKKQFCHIGSVKANIGHLDAGASIAGIIKTILSMKHKILPPLMHFKKPNPQINFTDSPFIINQSPVAWKKGTQARRAGISSFGLGGTNAHIILEEAPQIEKKNHKKPYELILLSAKKVAALQSVKEQYTKYFSSTDASLNAIAFTLQTGRKHFQQRAFLIAKDTQEARNILENPESIQVYSKESKSKTSKIVFMFPGGGAQHSNMGFDLFQEEPVFRNAVLECLNILKEDHQLDFLEILYPIAEEQHNQSILDPLAGITLLFTIEYATAKLWESWGIYPSELIGHSLGEYTAACIGGVFSLRDALALVAKRGKLFLKLKDGAMLSVALPAKAVETYLSV